MVSPILQLTNISKSFGHVQANKNINLTIVGTGFGNPNHLQKQSNINIMDCGNKDESIIKIYDAHNIFILPSFTEAHPQVLDESLARKRPVIIFDEINHVIQGRAGVYVSKRDFDSLLEKINFIIKNYSIIQNDMRKNILPTKKKFISELVDILS